jgi:hypothetical protein
VGWSSRAVVRGHPTITTALGTTERMMPGRRSHPRSRPPGGRRGEEGERRKERSGGVEMAKLHSHVLRSRPPSFLPSFLS